MKLIAIFITNNAKVYGGAQQLRQVVLFVFTPFEKNTLGDIVAIRDENGNIVAEYVYDAWGNILSQSGTMASVNPFRYRGYYYDTETGFYYLQTRYYDPTIMRFINADDYELVSTLAASRELNLYAYCNNNPIMYTDETGEGIISLLVGLGITFAIGFGGSIVNQGLQYGWNDISLLQAGIDGAFAMLSVGLAYTSISIGASIAIGASMGATQYTINSTLIRNDFTWGGLLDASILGALGGAFSGAGAKNAGEISKLLNKGGNLKLSPIISYCITNQLGTNGPAMITLQGIITSQFIKAAMKIWSTTTLAPIAKFYLMG